MISQEMLDEIKYYSEHPWDEHEEEKKEILKKSDYLYDTFMYLIGKFNNNDLLKLSKSIIEYVENDL